MPEVLTWALRAEIIEIARDLYTATHEQPGTANDWVPYLYEKRPRLMLDYPPIAQWENNYAERIVEKPVVVAAAKAEPVKAAIKPEPKKQVHRVKKDSSLLKGKAVVKPPAKKKPILPVLKKAVAKAVVKAKAKKK